MLNRISRSSLLVGFLVYSFQIEEVAKDFLFVCFFVVVVTNYTQEQKKYSQIPRILEPTFMVQHAWTSYRPAGPFIKTKGMCFRLYVLTLTVNAYVRQIASV